MKQLWRVTLGLAGAITRKTVLVKCVQDRLSNTFGMGVGRNYQKNCLTLMYNLKFCKSRFWSPLGTVCFWITNFQFFRQMTRNQFKISRFFEFRHSVMFFVYNYSPFTIANQLLIIILNLYVKKQRIVSKWKFCQLSSVNKYLK